MAKRARFVPRSDCPQAQPGSSKRRRQSAVPVRDCEARVEVRHRALLYKAGTRRAEGQSTTLALL
jgi:hypothetical protein